MREEWDELEQCLVSGHGVVSTQEVLAAGISRHALQWAVRQGRLTTLRRGVHTTADRWASASPERRHVLRLLDGRHRLVTEADDLWEEKRREDALREAGYRVIRFAMSDHRAPAAWVAAYRRLLVGTG